MELEFTTVGQGNLLHVHIDGITQREGRYSVLNDGPSLLRLNISPPDGRVQTIFWGSKFTISGFLVLW